MWTCDWSLRSPFVMSAKHERKFKSTIMAWTTATESSPGSELNMCWGPLCLNNSPCLGVKLYNGTVRAPLDTLVLTHALLFFAIFRVEKSQPGGPPQPRENRFRSHAGSNFSYHYTACRHRCCCVLRKLCCCNRHYQRKQQAADTSISGRAVYLRDARLRAAT